MLEAFSTILLVIMGILFIINSIGNLIVSYLINNFKRINEREISDALLRDFIFDWISKNSERKIFTTTFNVAIFSVLMGFVLFLFGEFIVAAIVLVEAATVIKLDNSFIKFNRKYMQ